MAQSGLDRRVCSLLNSCSRTLSARALSRATNINGYVNKYWQIYKQIWCCFIAIYHFKMCNYENIYFVRSTTSSMTRRLCFCHSTVQAAIYTSSRPVQNPGKSLTIFYKSINLSIDMHNIYLQTYINIYQQ